MKYLQESHKAQYLVFFIIYINDIADKLVSLSRLFADDTSFGYSNQDTIQLKNVIDHDLNEMDIW